MYKWGNDNWQYNYIFHLSKLWKARFSILCDVYFWWGCRGNLKLITSGSEGVGRNNDPIWLDLVFPFVRFFFYFQLFIRSARQNADTAVIHELDSPIKSRYIRFRIRRFIGWPCLRVEIYGGRWASNGTAHHEDHWHRDGIAASMQQGTFSVRMTSGTM